MKLLISSKPQLLPLFFLLFALHFVNAQTQVGGDIDGEAAGDQSGWSVSMSSNGNRVAIGAKRNDGNGSNSGHVRIYEDLDPCGSLNTFTWNGSQNNDLLNPQNWTPNCSPAAGKHLEIVSGTPNNPVLSNNLSIASMEINSGASFTIKSNNTLTIGSTNSSIAAIHNEGTLDNNGTIQISGHAGTHALINTGAGANFTNDGSITGDKKLQNTNGATFQNDGDIDLTEEVNNDAGPSNVFTNNGQLSVTNNHINAFGTFTNNGRIDLNWTTSLTTLFVGSNNDAFINNDTINVSGRFTSTQGGAIKVNQATNNTVENSTTGVINVSASGTNAAGIFLQGKMDNYGRININSTQSRGILMEQNGPFTNHAGGEIHVYSGPVSGLRGWNSGGQIDNYGDLYFYAGISGEAITGYVNNYGTIHGIGTINGANFTNPGTVAPGFSPGIFMVNGGLNLIATTIYNAEIEGTDGAGVSNGNDQVAITGTGNLDGTLNVNLISGFDPSVNDAFVLVTCSAGCTGTFSTVNLPIPADNWLLDYNANDVTLTLLQPLPVELVSFRAHSEKDYNLLLWQTASEENNKGFDIQRSHNGRDWTALDFVTGIGTSNSLNEYTYRDFTPLLGTNFYRLKQVDYNGDYEYSNVVAVNNEFNQQVQIYPNPGKGIFYIAGAEQGEVRIQNQLGITIHSASFQNSTLDLSHLPKDIYIIQITSKNQMSVHQVFKH